MADKNFIHRILITAKDEASAVFNGVKGVAAGVAAAIAGFFGTKLLGDSVQAAEDLDVQMRKLEATVQATGGAAGLTAQEIDKLARELDEATLGSAAGFRDAATQLLTFKSVAGDTFKETLRLAQDLAAAGFGSLEGNVVQLGKALENPISGLGALAEAGVTFTAQQKELINELVQTGQQAKAQGVILEAVAGQVKGVASAAGSGLTGVRDLIGKLTTDIQEAFGAKLLPALTTLGNKVAEALRAFRDSGAAETLGNALAYLAERADKVAKIIAVAIGVTAVRAVQGYVVALNAAVAATSAKTLATGALTLAVNAFANAGKAAAGAAIALGGGVAGATRAIWEKVAAMGALRAAMRALGWGAVAVEVANLASNYLELRKQTQALKEAQESADETEAKLAARLRIISDVTGVTVRNMKEFNAAVAEGRIVWDEATNSWRSGAAAVSGVGTAAEATRFKLTEVQRLFVELRADGVGTADALAKIAAAADFSSVDGVAKLVADLQLLQKSALATGNEIQTALVDRLARLSGKDLRDFGIQAEMAFNRGAISAEQFAEILDARTVAAARQLGVEVNLAVDGISDAFRNAEKSLEVVIGSFDQLKAAGLDTSEILKEAIGGALDTASTMEEFNRLLEVVERLGEEGKLAGADVAEALDLIRTKAEQVLPGINSVEEALKKLGITSDSELKKAADAAKEAFRQVVALGGSAREVQEAFRAYAEKAVAANEGVVDSTLSAEAAQVGLKVSVDESGKVTVQSMKAAKAATKEVGDAAELAAGKFALIASEARGAAGVVTSAWDEAGNLVADATDRAVKSAGGIVRPWLEGAEATSRYAREAGEVAFRIATAFNSTVASIEAARKAAESFVAQMEELDRRQAAMNSTAADGVSDLEFRLLQLEGTQEEIAKAERDRDRDQAKVRRQIELLRLDVRRAQLRGDTESIQKLQAEIALFERQLQLIDRSTRRSSSRARPAPAAAGRVAVACRLATRRPRRRPPLPATARSLSAAASPSTPRTPRTPAKSPARSTPNSSAWRS